jgi:carbon monoxide dehydrogenase subunit G
MQTIQFDYEVAAQPDRVFAALTDLRQVGDWRTLESVRLEPDGPTRIGSRIYTTVKGPGQTMRFVNEVTQLDPVTRRYDDRWLEGTFPIESGWQIEATATGTRIRWTTRYQPRGILRLLGPLLGRMIRQGQQKDLARFAGQLTAH